MSGSGINKMRGLSSLGSMTLKSVMHVTQKEQLHFSVNHTRSPKLVMRGSQWRLPRLSPTRITSFSRRRHRYLQCIEEERKQFRIREEFSVQVVNTEREVDVGVTNTNPVTTYWPSSFANGASLHASVLLQEHPEDRGQEAQVDMTQAAQLFQGRGPEHNSMHNLLANEVGKVNFVAGVAAAMKRASEICMAAGQSRTTRAPRPAGVGSCTSRGVSFQFLHLEKVSLRDEEGKQFEKAQRREKLLCENVKTSRGKLEGSASSSGPNLQGSSSTSTRTSPFVEEDQDHFDQVAGPLEDAPSPSPRRPFYRKYVLEYRDTNVKYTENNDDENDEVYAEHASTRSDKVLYFLVVEAQCSAEHVAQYGEDVLETEWQMLLMLLTLNDNEATAEDQPVDHEVASRAPSRTGIESSPGSARGLANKLGKAKATTDVRKGNSSSKSLSSSTRNSRDRSKVKPNPKSRFSDRVIYASSGGLEEVMGYTTKMQRLVLNSNRYKARLIDCKYVWVWEIQIARFVMLVWHDSL